MSKIIQVIKTRQSELVLILAVILIAVIAFESGRISALRQSNGILEIKRPDAEIEPAFGNRSQQDALNARISTEKATSALGRVIASKNSTLYHFFWCSGAQRIKEENKIIFSSEQEAQSRGYKLASNCAK